MEQILVTSGTLIILGCCLRISLRLLYGARGPASDDEAYFLMRILSSVLIVAPATLLAISGAYWMAILLIIVVLEALYEYTLARRAVQRQAAWRLTTAALADDRIAARSLAFHSPRFTGIVGRWYRRLVADLAAGMPWLAAIHANRRALPREASTHAAIAGEDAASAELQLDESRDLAFTEVRQQIIQRLWYLVVISVMMAAVVTFVQMKIVPAFIEIFADFDLELPRITQDLFSVTGRFNETTAPAVTAAILGFVLMLAAVAVCYLCDWPVLRPLTDRLAFSRLRADVMRLLAAAVERGQPIGDALETLVSGFGAYPAHVMRRRLAAAGRDVEAGQPWQEALCRVHVLSARDAAILRTAQDVGNVPWALRMLAGRRLRALAFRWTVVQHLAFAAIILLMGFFVFWFAAAMLIPLAQMIMNLSQP